MRKASYVLYLVSIIVGIVSTIYAGIYYLAYISPELQKINLEPSDPNERFLLILVNNVLPTIMIYAVIITIASIILAIIARVKLSSDIEYSTLKTIGIFSIIVGAIGAGIPIILAGIFAICAANKGELTVGCKYQIRDDYYDNNDSRF